MGTIMNKIERENLKILKNEICDLNKIFNIISINKNSDILSMGYMRYFIILEIEALNYIEKNFDIKIKEKLKYKKKLENCRARIKPLEGDSQSIYNKYEKMNINEMERYTKNLDPYIKEKFKSLITNMGVYKIKNIIISNTFELNRIYKEIILEEGDYNSKKVFDISQELGEILAYINRVLNITREYKKINIDFEINSEDYDVMKENTELFNNKIDRNLTLLLFDIMCMTNFYNNIISIFPICDSTKYRIAYITFNNVHNNIKKCFQINKELNLNICMNDLEDIIIKYDYLNEKNFRNAMFHYDLKNDLNEQEIKDEMYLGIIKKYLNVTEVKLKTDINNYLKVISEELEKLIMN